MSAAAKYHVSRVIVALTVPVMCYALSKMIPAGLNGNTSVVWHWFAVFAVIAVSGVTAFVIMSYNKSLISDAGGKASEAEILAAAEADLTRRRQEPAVTATAKNKGHSSKLPSDQGL